MDNEWRPGPPQPITDFEAGMPTRAQVERYGVGARHGEDVIPQEAVGGVMRKEGVVIGEEGLMRAERSE